MSKITVELPEGNTCMYNDGHRRPCLLASYTKKWNAYNCKLYNKILRGNQEPRKCAECIAANKVTNEHTNNKEGDTNAG